MIQLTSREHAVIIGSLLGDGFMQRSTSLTNKSRLRFCHSIKQKEYVDWKRTSLTRLCEKTQSSKIVLRSQCRGIRNVL
jgi:LAGLIDADG DNA endonuclease family